MSNSPTVKSLKADLTAANIEFPKKAKKAELEALLAAATAPAETTAPRKQRTSTKQIIRDLFQDVGFEMSVEDVQAHVLAQASVAPATIVTMIGDLKNPKYCGKDGVFHVERVGDNYKRIDVPSS
jgi:hypothetical protein